MPQQLPGWRVGLCPCASASAGRFGRDRCAASNWGYPTGRTRSLRRRRSFAGTEPRKLEYYRLWRSFMCLNRASPPRALQISVTRHWSRPRACLVTEDNKTANQRCSASAPASRWHSMRKSCCLSSRSTSFYCTPSATFPGRRTYRPGPSATQCLAYCP